MSTTIYQFKNVALNATYNIDKYKQIICIVYKIFNNSSRISF